MQKAEINQINQTPNTNQTLDLNEVLKTVNQIIDLNSQLLRNKLKHSDDRLVAEAQDLAINLMEDIENHLAQA